MTPRALPSAAGGIDPDDLSLDQHNVSAGNRPNTQTRTINDPIAVINPKSWTGAT